MTFLANQRTYIGLVLIGFIILVGGLIDLNYGRVD
jgi:uncharacterized membrane protein YidH (DUF202 family)